MSCEFREKTSQIPSFRPSLRGQIALGSSELTVLLVYNLHVSSQGRDIRVRFFARDPIFWVKNSDP